MEYTLGLDMGETSLGWCIVKTEKGKPVGIEKMGVRIFSDGRNAKTKEPLAVSRRKARGARRRRDRFVMRRTTLMNKLIQYGFMPKDEAERKELQKLDPYKLRVDALERKLNPYELGRILFHINQRRGFKSNRKADRKNAEAGAMQTAIDILNQKMAETNARSLGEYLYNLNKDKNSTQEYVTVHAKSHMEKSKACYDMYPERSMYEHELRLIFEKQKIAKEIADDLFDTIMSQRPLKTPEKGHCTLEESEYRCYIAYPCFQKFRALQQINQLKIKDDFREYDLTTEQKKQLKHYLLEDFSKLDKDFHLTFAQAKKILGLNKEFKFNLESERRKGLDADKTTALLQPYFLDIWNERANEIVDLLLDTEQEKDLSKKLSSYKLTESQIDEIIKISLPDGTGSLSVKAINKLLPYLEQGLMYDKAVEAAGYDFSLKTKGVLPEHYTQFINPETGECYDELPYYGQALKRQVIGGSFNETDKNDVEKYFGKINNPTVHIGLNQLRKLINAIVKKYGHPNKIVVELARELKMSQEQRKKMEQQQTANEKENVRISNELERLGITNNYDNRMKYKLWEDSAKEPQNRCCPFCGKKISGAELAMSAEFEIEHLLPFSRSYLDSRSNKVLSCRQCNREKKNNSPWEAFHNDATRWNEILARVERLPADKRWKFEENAFKRLSDDKGDVLSRMLSDTQYLSKIARQYLCLVTHPTKVQGIPGQLTAKLRHHWGLNAVLSDENKKDRGDHRHHAIDAFVVACTSRDTLQQYSTERRDFMGIMPQEQTPHLPYPTYRQADIQNLYDNLIISHKLDQGNASKAIQTGKTVAQLHEETYYGCAGEGSKKGTLKLTRRISVEEIKTLADLDKLVDQQGTANPIRNFINGYLPNEAEARIQEYFKNRGMIKVKVYEEKSADSLVVFKDKKGEPYRYAVGGSNAYAEIYCPDRGKKAGKWVAEIISDYNAHQKDFIPKWRHTDAHAKLIMRLHKNDMIAYEKDGETIIARVKKMRTDGRICFRPHQIAKEDGDTLSWETTADNLRINNARKIYVDMLGNIHDPLKK